MCRRCKKKKEDRLVFIAEVGGNLHLSTKMSNKIFYVVVQVLKQSVACSIQSAYLRHDFTGRRGGEGGGGGRGSREGKKAGRW